MAKWWWAKATRELPPSRVEPKLGESTCHVIHYARENVVYVAMFVSFFIRNHYHLIIPRQQQNRLLPFFFIEDLHPIFINETTLQEFRTNTKYRH